MNKQELKRAFIRADLVLKEMLNILRNTPQDLEYDMAIYKLEALLWAYLKELEKYLPKEDVITLEHQLYDQELYSYTKVFFSLSKHLSRLDASFLSNTPENAIDST